MMEDVHIADGIAVKLLLAGIVLASGAMGGLGLAPATAQSAHEVGDGPADDRAYRLLFPIDNVTVGTDGSVRLLFPIDNVTLVRGHGRVPADLSLAARDDPYAFDRDVRPRFRTQDMDPYVFPQDMDPY
jgi:hypothetical protein